MDPPKKRSLMRHSGWFSKPKPAELRPLRQAYAERDTAVGERRFGKAYVNCALRGNNTRWGELRNKDAAVLQLRFDSRQDEGYKLSEFVVELSLTEKDPRSTSGPPSTAMALPTAIPTAVSTAVPTPVTLSPGPGTSATVAAATFAEPSLLILEPPSPRYLKGQGDHPAHFARSKSSTRSGHRRHQRWRDWREGQPEIKMLNVLGASRATGPTTSLVTIRTLSGLGRPSLETPTLKTLVLW